MSMADFNNTWRKRLACQRCRHLKVRCEYSSPTSDTCTRCQKSNSVCIIPTPKNKDGQENNDRYNSDWQNNRNRPAAFSAAEENKEEHAVYLRRIIRDAEQKLLKMNVSPLRQALSANLYTVEEANKYYAQLRRLPNAFPAVQLLDLPEDIMEVDKSWPWLSIAIVTSMALNTTGKPVGEMLLFTQELYRCGLDYQTYQATLDRQLAFALMCQYAMSFHDRSVNVLLQLHGLTVTTMKELHRAGEYKLEKLAAHVAAVTILPYTIMSRFSAIRHLSYFYSPLVIFRSDEDSIANVHISPNSEPNSLSTPQTLAAGPFMEVLMNYNKTLRDLDMAGSLEEVMRLVENSIQFIELLANHTLVINVEFSKLQNSDMGCSPAKFPNSENFMLSPLQASYLYAKMNLLKRAATRIMELRMCVEQGQYVAALHSIISQATEFGGRLFRGFTHIDSANPFARTTIFYHVSDALLIVQMMRYTSFVCGVNADVHADCLLDVVTMKWEEMLRTSILIRQLYLLLFEPLSMSNVKIGIYEQSTNSVVGSGNISIFNIIYFDSRTRTIRDTKPLTRKELGDLIDEASRIRELGTKSPNWSEHVETPSLATVLHVLVYKY